MHGVNYLSSVNGSNVLFEFSFKIDNTVIEVKDTELIHLVKDLNTLFSRLVNDIQQYARQQGKDDYAYYRRLVRVDFIDFNLLYDCELLYLKNYEVTYEHASFNNRNIRRKNKKSA